MSLFFPFFTASLNQWYINTVVRDKYENDHKIVPNEVILGASGKPKFLYFIASEDLFLPIWKAESAKLIAEIDKITAEALEAGEAAEIAYLRSYESFRDF